MGAQWLWSRTRSHCVISFLVSLKTHSMKRPNHVISFEAQKSARWRGIEIWRGVSAQASSSSPDRGSKLHKFVNKQAA
ncbi:hypothetical protein TNCV_4950461 [Trichonephila clavipes]|nr:hypothetical protein TNCV_4950461 [Trichonephila clavipes]